MSTLATCSELNTTACSYDESYVGLECDYAYDVPSASGPVSDYLGRSSPSDPSPLLLPFQDVTTSTSLITLCTIMVLMRYLRSQVLQPALGVVGKRLGEYTHGPGWVNEHQEQMENFKSFSFRLGYRCIVCGLGLIEFYRNPEYWYDTQQLWEGHETHVINNGIQILYILQLAYHLEDLGSVMFEGNARKRADFGSMIVHHIATALLLVGSSMAGLHRIGVVVSTLHAITDVPKDFTQVAKQLDWKLCKNTGFVVLLITWVAARVILYPFKYVRSVVFEARQFIVHEGGISETALTIFIAMLSVLVILNGMWCHMLVKLVIRVLSEGDKVADPMLTQDASTAGKNSEAPIKEKVLDDEEDDDDIVGTGSDTESETSLETCSRSSLDSASDHEVQS